MSKFRWIMSDKTLSVLIGGRTLQVDRSSPNWDEIKAALSNPDTAPSELMALMNPAEGIRQAVAAADADLIEIRNGRLYFDGREVHTSLGRRIADIAAEGLPIEPWVAFARNVYANPFKEAREELYDFLERSNLPITEDGCFVAFKWVNGNYRDCFSDTFDNRIGQILEMPREEVDPVRSNHCSTGFHFCSYNYLQNFSGKHIMIVKINPADVVSIPDDYDYAKGRTCRYEVIGEVPEERLPNWEWDPVYTDPESLDTDDEGESCECGDSLDDGEGWDGLCGNCADALEGPLEDETYEVDTSKFVTLDASDYEIGNLVEVQDGTHQFGGLKGHITEFRDNIYGIRVDFEDGGYSWFAPHEITNTVPDKETTTKKGKVRNKMAKIKTRRRGIETGHIGRLTKTDFKKAVKEHGTMANWARSLGIPTSTVRNWKARLWAA